MNKDNTNFAFFKDILYKITFYCNFKENGIDSSHNCKGELHKNKNNT